MLGPTTPRGARHRLQLRRTCRPRPLHRLLHAARHWERSRALGAKLAKSGVGGGALAIEPSLGSRGANPTRPAGGGTNGVGTASGSTKWLEGGPSQRGVRGGDGGQRAERRAPRPSLCHFSQACCCSAMLNVNHPEKRALHTLARAGRQAGKPRRGCCTRGSAAKRTRAAAGSLHTTPSLVAAVGQRRAQLQGLGVLLQRVAHGTKSC